ncbi:MAG: hypothetical protein JRN62_02880 [Nitrososphaerota archaeon]|jgi:hypothetical protein|nr:hypothetical protein [Nitrososphaerota archaeon]MDG6948939.1 hypothetical protein [Nitrososphaerota archaeon]
MGSAADYAADLIKNGRWAVRIDVVGELYLMHHVYNKYSGPDFDEMMAATKRNPKKVKAGDALFRAFTPGMLDEIFDMEKRTGMKLTMKHMNLFAKIRPSSMTLKVAENVCRTHMPANTLATLIDTGVLNIALQK